MSTHEKPTPIESPESREGDNDRGGFSGDAEAPEESVLTVISRSDLPNVATDLLELGIDELTADGIARELPLVGTMVRLTRTGLAIRDWLFLRKLGRFLNELADIPSETREEFVRNIRRDRQEQQRVGEGILLLLERLDDMKKPTMAGRIFGVYVAGRIDRDTHQRLQSSLERIRIQSIPGLLRLCRKYEEEGPDSLWRDNPVDDVTMQDLIMAGLVDMKLQSGFLLEQSANYDQIMEHARLFVEIALDSDLAD